MDASVLKELASCSNRTFMELKYDVALFLQLCFERSNRTFMELKFRHGAHSHV